jgi:tripartite-type tricarboxylate transporter receptor subunit TctC
MKVKKVAQLLAFTAALVSSTCFAQAFPSKPIRVVVPFPPGGNLDATTRVVMQSMSKILGQPIIVDNRGGAGGMIGADAVAKSKPDGYTLLAGTNGPLVVSPVAAANAPYQVKDFAPIGMMTTTPLVLEVSSVSPHGDFKSFIAFARANAGKLNIAHAGNGTTNHIAILRLQEATSTEFTAVPYKGGGPAVTDLLAGVVDGYVDQITGSLQQIKAGKFKPLAVTSKTRVPELPNVPTLQELGLKNFEVLTFAGLMAPAKTPPEVVKTLNAALNRALTDAEVRKQLRAAGADPRPVGVAEFEQFIKNEQETILALKRAGLLKLE